MNQDNKSLMIAGVVVAAILAIGIGVFALSGSDDDTDTMNTSESSQKADKETTDGTPSQQVEPAQNIVELAVATNDLSTLVTAVTEAELVDTLSGSGPFTVFAPTNDAFAGLPEGTLDTLLMPENQADLQGVLTYHVVAAEVMSNQLSDGQVVETVQGGSLTVRISGGNVMLEDATGAMARVVTADIEASNGVVHVIDKVVLPQ